MENYTAIPPRVKHRASYGLAKWVTMSCIIVLIAGSILIGLLQIQAPSPLSSNAPLDEFSSARAMDKLKVIAKEPHSIMTPAHAEVRDYLLQELKALGLEPEIQKSYVISDLYNASGLIENIITRIPGTDNSKAIVIAAHYDSVRTGPGAADDGAAIAAMLETMRALQVSGPLKNDLILLMTDGEEVGLLGAEAFIKEHRWVQDIGLVLNFEARGNKGPSFMFETSEQNGWIVKEFMKAATHPIGYSLIYNLYKLMPNDTDMTVFRQGGLDGLNFAFGMGLDAYHNISDTLENLDPASLQHHGDYMLSLSRHFGNLNLDEVKQEDRVYFNVFGWNMVSYPQSWAMGFMIFGVLLFLGTIWHGMHRRRMNLKGMAGGFLITLLSLGIVYGVIKLLWSILRTSVTSENYEMIMIIEPRISNYYLVGLLFITILITFVFIRWTSRYIRMENIWIGTMILWLLLCVGSTLYLPGGSYLFIWPFIFSLIGLNVGFRMRGEGTKWASAVSSMTGFIMFAPICYLVYVMLTLHIAEMLMTVIALAFTLIFPLYCRGLKPSPTRSSRGYMVEK